MTVQGVVLENHRYIPVLGRKTGAILAVYYKVTACNIFKSCNHSKRGGLAAAGGTYQNDKFAVGNIQVEIANRFFIFAAFVYLFDML